MAPSHHQQIQTNQQTNTPPALGPAGPFLLTEDRQDNNTKEGLPPLMIPDPHDPLPTPMDTSLPHTSPEQTIPFGTHTPPHPSPSLQSQRIPAGTMMAPASTQGLTIMDQIQVMSSLGALIPMDDGRDMDMESDHPLPHRGLMAQQATNHTSPSMVTPDTINRPDLRRRGLNMSMEDLRARSPASMSSSSRVFGSGGRDGSRGLGTPPPPPAITTTISEENLMMDSQDQQAAPWGFEAGAIGMPPTPVSANIDTERKGMRQTSRRRSPPGALVLGTAGGMGLGMGLPSSPIPMHGSSKPTMKLGARAASAFSTRVASPLSALAASNNGANSPHPGLMSGPLTPGSTTNHLNSYQQQQQQAARQGLFLHSQPSSPNVQAMTGASVNTLLRGTMVQSRILSPVGVLQG